MQKADVQSLWRNIETVAKQLNVSHAFDAVLVKWTFPRLDVNVSVQKHASDQGSLQHPS